MTLSSSPPVVLRLLALASLGLNLFLGAMLASSALNTKPDHTGSIPDRIFERIAGTLPADEAARLRKAFDSRRVSLAALSQEFRTAQERVRTVAATEPLDPVVLRQAYDTARAKRRQIGDRIEEILLEVTPDLSESGRRRLYGGG